MSQATDRVPCPKCQASNFASSAVCWQCGQPLSGPQVQATGETPGAPTPPTSPGYGPPPTAPPPASDNTQLLVILGFLFAPLGIICCPIFPIIGIILGVMILRRGNQLGTWIIVANVVLLLAGLVVMSVLTAHFMKMMPRSGGLPPYSFPQPK